MQVQNPEEIISSEDKKKVLPYLVTPLIIIIVALLYFFGPSVKEIKNFLGITQGRTFLNPKDENKTEIKKTYKDAICNDLPDDYRIDTWAEGKPEVKINTFVGCDDDTKKEGLMGVVALPYDEGMLFVFEKPDLYQFWMKDTSVYISVAFLNEKQEIIEIFDPEPLSEEKFGPENIKSKYVLEVTKGWFKDHDVKPGDKIIFDNQKIKNNEKTSENETKQ